MVAFDESGSAAHGQCPDVGYRGFDGRDRSWGYCRIALEFFRDESIPIEKTRPADELVGNPEHDSSKYCLAQPGQCYLVYLPEGGSTQVNLESAEGDFELRWFNPRTGQWASPQRSRRTAGQTVTLSAPADDKQDWLAVLKKAP